MSIRHPARFVLVGSGNPEEGELRPQLLDRFGLSVEVVTPADPKSRVEIIRRRDAFERDPEAFTATHAKAEASLRRRIVAAVKHVGEIEVSDSILEQAAALCIALGTDGLRGELTLIRASRALAALNKAKSVTIEHVRTVAPSALRHRLRRDPLDETGSNVRIERAVEEVLGG
jgi:magnesium chelatase subunit I